MATDREWADAYLAQARADLEGGDAIGGIEPSTFAMLLQMVFEKLAKAALVRQGAVSLAWARGNHAAASRMVKAMRLQQGLLAPMGSTKNWHDVLWAIEALDQAHPQIAANGRPQLEYPWESRSGAIRWPARDLPIAATFGNPGSNLGARVLRFARLLSRQLDPIFPQPRQSSLTQHRARSSRSEDGATLSRSS